MSMDLNKIEFTKEFNSAFDILEKSSQNVFITGRAGTGKSTFLSFFVENTEKDIVVLAPTGVAALNVSGQTIHSFFGFKPGVTLSEAKQIALNKKKTKLFKELDSIIIDEISMTRADLLDCVNVFLQTVLNSKKPFGGKQVIFIGDLYQLAPVVKGEEKEVMRKNYNSPYFFDAKVMNSLNLRFFEFTKIFRQNEKKFIELLNKIRNRTVTKRDVFEINKRFKPEIENDKGFIYLTCTNKLAEEINAAKLEKLSGKLTAFNGLIQGDFSLKSLPADQALMLKKGAQVMFLVNDSQGRWVNGSLGVIEKIFGEKVQVILKNKKTVRVSPYSWEIFKFYYNSKINSISKEIIGSFTQLPLRLAWAVTIHKGQGKTFDKVIIDIGRGAFAYGQMYVALSRCTSFNGIILKKKLKESDIWMDWKVVKFLTGFQYAQAQKKLSNKEKEEILKQAIKEKNNLEIVYLKPNDTKSKRIIRPLNIGLKEYMGYEFKGLEAHCYFKNDSRIFKIERILEINPVSTIV